MSPGLQKKGVRKQRVGPYKRHKQLLSHQATFGSVGVLPATLGRAVKYVKDQGMSDYCTAFARSVAGSYMFGQEMSAEYMAAKEGEVAGAPITNGTDPQTADKAALQYGFLPQTQSPFFFSREGWIWPAQWQNYPPELDGLAIINHPGDPYDVEPTFDGIKEALVHGNDEHAVVVANGFWYSNFNNVGGDGIVTVPNASPLTRHSYLYIDFTTINGTEYLIAQLSQGTGFGDGGALFFNRQTIGYMWKSPIVNQIGCTISRQPNGQENQTLEVSLYQRLVQVLGHLLILLRLRV